MNTNEIRVLIQEHWGDAVLTAIDAEPALQMSFDEFLDHCAALWWKLGRNAFEWFKRTPS